LYFSGRNFEFGDSKTNSFSISFIQDRVKGARDLFFKPVRPYVFTENKFLVQQGWGEISKILKIAIFMVWGSFSAGLGRKIGCGFVLRTTFKHIWLVETV